MASGKPTNRRVVAAGLVGNVLEWYDFAVYGYLAPAIGYLFFPSDDPTASLLAAFGAFAAGFLMRPIGGILLGHIGDRFGRRRALTISVAMMAVPTFLMGVLPTTADIGVAAAFVLVIMRMIQGLAVGGEYIGSFAFLAERAPSGRKNFYTAWSLVGGIMGTLMGSGVAAFFASITDEATMSEWGWRIPFLLSAVVAVLAFFIRRSIADEAMPAKPKRMPVVEAAQTNWPQILQVIGLTVITAVTFYTIFIYVAAWLPQQTSMSHAQALDINTIALLVLLVGIPSAGLLADRLGCRRTLIVGSASFLVFSYPLLWLMHHDSFILALAGQAGLAVVLSIYAGAMPVSMADLFPRHVRMSAMGLSYNVTYAALGGTAPLVAGWLVGSTGDAMAFAWYMILAAFVSFAVTFTLPKTLGQKLE